MNQLQNIVTVENLKKVDWSKVVQLFNQARESLQNRIKDIDDSIKNSNSTLIVEYQKTADTARDQMANTKDDYELAEKWWKRLLEIETKIENLVNENKQLDVESKEKETKKLDLSDKIAIGAGIGFLSVLGALAWDYIKNKK